MAVTVYKPEWAAKRTIRGVLFDMDGLVLDSEILYTRFWQEAVRFYGEEMTWEQGLSMRGLGKQAAKDMFRKYYGDKLDHPTVREKRIELMEAYVNAHGVACKPGIFELLDYLDSQGIPAAITSSSPIGRIQTYLARHNLDTRFAALCSGRDVPKGKPDPDIYLYGAASLNLRPEECLALEDAPAGIESAYRAGCLPVMVPDQDQPQEETQTMLYAKADSLVDIIDLLESLK